MKAAHGQPAQGPPGFLFQAVAKPLCLGSGVQPKLLMLSQEPGLADGLGEMLYSPGAHHPHLQGLFDA